MTSTPRRAARVTSRCPLVAAGLALAAPATAGASHHDTSERLVVRGDRHVGPAACPGGVCPLELTDGTFRGTPVGTGAYSGAIKLEVAEAFPNGEGGVCAPIRGSIMLGAGSPDRLVLAVAGDSCQDGAGDPTDVVVHRPGATSPSSTAPARTPRRAAAASRRSPRTPRTTIA